MSKCNNENKVLITFTILEGALVLKNKGFNPTFVLVLPEDKSLYKVDINNSIQKYYKIQNGLITDNVNKKKLKTFRYLEFYYFIIVALIFMYIYIQLQEPTLNEGTAGQYFNEIYNNSSRYVRVSLNNFILCIIIVLNTIS